MFIPKYGKNNFFTHPHMIQWLRLSTCTLLDSKLVCTGASEIRQLFKKDNWFLVINPHETARFWDSSHGRIPPISQWPLEELRMLCRPLGFTLQEMEVTEILQEQGGSPAVLWQFFVAES